MEAGSQVMGFTKSRIPEFLSGLAGDSNLHVLPAFTEDDVTKKISTMKASQVKRSAAQSTKGII